MESRKEVDYKIDWHSVDFNALSFERAERVVADRKHYFSMLSRFLLDIKNLGLDKIDDVFAKYNVHFIDIDDIERVNLDEPE